MAEVVATNAQMAGFPISFLDLTMHIGDTVGIIAVSLARNATSARFDCALAEYFRQLIPQVFPVTLDDVSASPLSEETRVNLTITVQTRTYPGYCRVTILMFLLC